LKGISYTGSAGTLSLNPSFIFDALGVKGVESFGWNNASSAVGILGQSIAVVVMPLSS
jgi:hypothetical protein